MKSAHHGQNQEKERNSDYWIAYFPFKNFFDGKQEKTPTTGDQTFKMFLKKKMLREILAILAPNEEVDPE